MEFALYLYIHRWRKGTVVVRITTNFYIRPRPIDIPRLWRGPHISVPLAHHYRCASVLTSYLYFHPHNHLLTLSQSPIHHHLLTLSQSHYHLSPFHTHPFITIHSPTHHHSPSHTPPPPYTSVDYWSFLLPNFKRLYTYNITHIYSIFFNCF